MRENPLSRTNAETVTLFGLSVSCHTNKAVFQLRSQVDTDILKYTLQSSISENHIKMRDLQCLMQ